jgi:anti-sigma-K factor RskA
MSEHEELESSVAAWVLGALDGDEADVVRIHAEGCASCREMEARLRRAVAALPLEVDEVPPPARLRERVLAAATASRGPSSVMPRPRAKVLGRPRRGPQRWLPTGRMPAVALAATALLALLVGLVAGDLVGRGTAPPGSSQVARFSLVGHGNLSGARATVIDLKNDELALVDFNGLPPLAAGKVYEVWLITSDGRPDAVGVFVPDSNGSKVVLVNRSLAGYSLMAVTTEEGPDGTTAPTQQPELSGSLA